jgi:hypothetical protein
MEVLYQLSYPGRTALQSGGTAVGHSLPEPESSSCGQGGAPNPGYLTRDSAEGRLVEVPDRVHREPGRDLVPEPRPDGTAMVASIVRLE